MKAAPTNAVAMNVKSAGLQVNVTVGNTSDLAAQCTYDATEANGLGPAVHREGASRGGIGHVDAVHTARVSAGCSASSDVALRTNTRVTRGQPALGVGFESPELHRRRQFTGT